MPCAWRASACTSARPRPCASSACPRRLRKMPCGTPSPGSWSAATLRGPPRPHERHQVRLEDHAEEPLELLLRLPHPPASAARGHLRRVRLLPHRGRRGGSGTGSRRSTRGACALAGGDPTRLRGHARAPGGRATAGGREALSHPALCPPRDHRRRRDGPRALDVRDLRGPLPVLLSRGLGGRALLHRDLRLRGHPGAPVRRRSRGGPPAHQHHARRAAGRPRRARLRAAGGPAELDPLALEGSSGVKAAVYGGPGDLELRDWPEPVAGAGELLVRVRGCGLCGSDILKILSPDTRAPAVFGHEVVGEVIAVGAAVTRFSVGQRVVVAHHVPCFRCHYCRRGSASMCRAFKRINLDPGGFAEVCRVPAPNVEHATFALPPGMSDETASFVEPLACCLRAVKRSGAVAGDAALVIGLGSIGCLLSQAFALAGTAVFGTDLVAGRRALGRAAGARVFDVDAELDAALSEATEGRGADVAMLTAGGGSLLPWVAARLRDGGHVHYFAGGDGAALPLPLADLYHRELTISSTYSSSPTELREAFDALATGRIRVDGLITHRLPLGELARGVELMRRHEAVKVYVTP